MHTAQAHVAALESEHPAPGKTAPTFDNTQVEPAAIGMHAWRRIANPYRIKPVNSPRHVHVPVHKPMRDGVLCSAHDCNGREHEMPGNPRRSEEHTSELQS